MKTVKYLCKLCGQTFELPEGTEPVCPICGATGEHIVPVKSEGGNNKYAGTRTEEISDANKTIIRIITYVEQ